MKHIGEIDTERLTGGKIDTYIQDKNGNIISIENKINAKDQAYFIERYCNHEKESEKQSLLPKSYWKKANHKKQWRI